MEGKTGERYQETCGMGGTRSEGSTVTFEWGGA